MRPFTSEQLNQAILDPQAWIHPRIVLINDSLVVKAHDSLKTAQHEREIAMALKKRGVCVPEVYDIVTDKDHRKWFLPLERILGRDIEYAPDVFHLFWAEIGKVVSVGINPRGHTYYMGTPKNAIYDYYRKKVVLIDFVLWERQLGHLSEVVNRR